MSMKKIIVYSISLAALFAGAAFAHDAKRFPADAIVCEGIYDGHLQGVATDGAAIYWSFTKSIVKTDLTGKILATTVQPSHQGDCCVKDGVLYVAVNLGLFNTESKAVSEVWAYDTKDLSLIEKWKVPELRHGAGGITWKGERFYVVGGLPKTHVKNYVYEYTPDFTFVKRHDLSTGYTLLGIQTATFIRGQFIFGCYASEQHPIRTLISPPDLASFRVSDECASVGLAEVNGRLFCGRTMGGGAKDKYCGFLVPATHLEKDCARTAAFAPVKKKYIAHGWDLLWVSPKDVLANAEAFDDLAIDGVTLMINKKLANGRRISQESIMNDPRWPREELKDEIAVFREIVKHRSLKESFISSWWAPEKRLKWTDDAAWANFATNMATVAWLAKAGGLKGILVDAEDYPKTEQYFRQADDPPYEELAQLARRRGAEVFKAIFDEFPDAVILSFWMLTLHDAYFESAEPMAMAQSHGDVWPWFVNGMLDAMPPTARFVDGNEHAYLYKSEEKKFHRSACLQRTAAQGLVASENRQKYLAQLRAGFGLYLDSYINPTNSMWYLGPVDGSRLTHFAQNLTQATEAADEFVWIYGEKKTWIKWKNARSKRLQTMETWNEALPGFNDTLLRVKAPREYLRRQIPKLLKDGQAANLVHAVKRPWGTWRNEKKAQGTMGVEGTGVFLEGVGSGCHMIPIRGVKPGETYAVRMKMKGAGGSSVVYWQKNGRWQWQLPGYPVVFETGADDVWRTGEVLARVPEGATDLVLQLGAKQTPGQRVDFDAVEIVKIEK